MTDMDGWDAAGRHSFEERRKTDQRLARLEAEVSNIVRSLDGMAAQFREFVSGFTASQRTQWGPILSSAGVVLVILGMLFAFYQRDQSRFDRTVALVEQHVRDGHPRYLDEHLDAVEDRISRNYEKLEHTEDEVHMHQLRDERFTGATDERLRALERQVFRGGGG